MPGSPVAAIGWAMRLRLTCSRQPVEIDAARPWRGRRPLLAGRYGAISVALARARLTNSADPALLRLASQALLNDAPQDKKSGNRGADHQNESNLTNE